MKFGARILTTLVVMTGLVSVASAQSAQGRNAMRHAASFYAASERFGYTGTIAVYNTLKEAKQGKHAKQRRQIVPQRDGSLFVVDNAADYYADQADFLTNWYDDAIGDDGGIDNPNNTDFGFIQLFDGLNGEPTTVNSEIGYWDRHHRTFTVEVSGRNATYPDNFARLWNAGHPDVGGEGTRGTFLVYSYKLKASGMTAQDKGGGFFTNTSNPTNYSGEFVAVFLNQSVTSPESNGYYVVHLHFNNASWAALNGFALDDEFGSNLVHGGGGGH
jgi:hypothetical protein